MEQELDIRAYWRILLRWWWLLVLGVVVGGAAGLLMSRMTTPMYQATAKVLVQRGATPGTQSLSDIRASEELAENYRDLIKTRPVLEQVVETLSLPYGPGTLAGRISVASPRSLIEIKARDPDPQSAADIANATAQIFISDFRDQQFLQIAQFQTSLGQYGITQDPSIIAAQATTLSALRIAELAIPPSSPSSPRTRLNVVLGVALGLLVAGVAVFVLEYLDDRIRSPDELKALTGVTTLGSVVRYRTRNGLGPVTLADERSHNVMAESYKFLRTNLQFAALGKQNFKTLLVTSASPEEGKTTTAANLAISIAREGKSVILVDSDLRKPALHRIFGLSEQKGLTHLILGEATLEEVLVPTTVEGLQVIPAGPLPPDATHVLRSARVREVVEQIKSSADTVIFDSPPLLAVTDPMLLVPLTDGVLLVVDTQRTRRDAVKRGAESLQQATPPFVGAVLNKVGERGRGGYYHYYHYYHYYSYGDDGRGRRRRSEGRGLLSRVFRRGRSRRRSADRTQ